MRKLTVVPWRRFCSGDGAGVAAGIRVSSGGEFVELTVTGSEEEG
jgi:hypothetical protein